MQVTLPATLRWVRLETAATATAQCRDAIYALDAVDREPIETLAVQLENLLHGIRKTQYALAATEGEQR